jgi:enterochelin esterase family protein
MRKLIIFSVLILFAGSLSNAQTRQSKQAPPPPPPAGTKPASTNIVGSEYPRIDSLRKAYFRVRAPEAQSVVVSLGNVALTKGEDGFWTGVTAPLDPGFHYYTLKINSVDVADPSSETFFGAGRLMSGVEVPEEGVDFYDIKKVPHGDIRNRIYFSKTTGTWRRLNIYVPAGV